MHTLMRRQRGVALASAMIVLIILTLLGVAAMRASRLELRLSNNAQSQLSALQQAQSIADSVLANSTNFQILPGTHYFFCFAAASPYAPAHPPSPPFSSSGACANYTIGSTNYTLIGSLALPTVAASGVANPLPRNTYAQVLRNDPEFLSPSAVRSAETSGRAFDFTSFTVVAGYDNSTPVDANASATSASQPASGASEVVEGLYVRHNKAVGVTYQ